MFILTFMTGVGLICGLICIAHGIILLIITNEFIDFIPDDMKYKLYVVIPIPTILAFISIIMGCFLIYLGDL